ncbi:transposase [Saccharothrix lopnurensis]|uniref:Transposase n=1 Tax=Saccharothrix lopnurensis TaxID=1670621 RepID=A0ABW1P9H5_9PSEU
MGPEGSRPLGVHPQALRNWIRQDEADRGERDDRLTAAESGELRRLRRENAELKRANEILKTVSAFFASEPDPATVVKLVEQLRGRFSGRVRPPGPGRRLLHLPRLGGPPGRPVPP